MKRFIGLSTSLTAGILGYYTLSLDFSAKRVPTLIDLHHVHLKMPKYAFYQRIKCVLENTPSSLVLLDRP
jgi:hypothetical protein